jgi:hypothetical protein
MNGDERKRKVKETNEGTPPTQWVELEGSD